MQVEEENYVDFIGGGLVVRLEAEESSWPLFAWVVGEDLDSSALVVDASVVGILYYVRRMALFRVCSCFV